MNRVIMFGAAAFLTLILVFSGACSSDPDSESGSRRIAQDFIENDTTYVFDGLEDTLELTDTAAIDNGWRFSFEFDSAHPGYGDRTGQALAAVITHHIAVITVENGEVTSAVMDDYWDMKNKGAVNEVEIKLAPIEEVTVSLLKSNPAQVNVHIKGGLSDGCTTFHNIKVTREGDTINISVTVQRPKDAFCPAVYTTFEEDVNLGTDFEITKTYTVNVNDFKPVTFNY